MTETVGVLAVATDIAAAIERRDIDRLASLLSSEFVYRTPGGDKRNAEAFLQGVREIPGDIVFVRLGNLEVDLSPAGALVTGIQHARVRIEAQEIDDRRAFVDWFVREGQAWRLRAAIDLPMAHVPAQP
jgi:hypothetical protein